MNRYFLGGGGNIPGGGSMCSLFCSCDFGGTLGITGIAEVSFRIESLTGSTPFQLVLKYMIFGFSAS